MEIKLKVVPIRHPEPCPDGNTYLFNVQQWRSTDGGKTFHYAGYGRFCKNVQEIDDYTRAVFAAAGRG